MFVWRSRLVVRLIIQVGACMAETRKGRSHPTLQDLANVGGLTSNTISRALNDRPGVSAATHALIKAEAERLGYVPNVHARSLVLGSRKTIGVIVSNISNPFFSDLVSEVELQAQHAGYTVLLLLSYESAERERDEIGRASCRARVCQYG